MTVYARSWVNPEYGKLTCEYHDIFFKVKLREIKLEDRENKTSVIFNEKGLQNNFHVWINGLPLEYLKWFKRFKIENCSFKREDQDVFLEFTDWKGLAHPKGKIIQSIEISITFLDKNHSETLTVPLCLKVMGLKKYIKKKFPSQVPKAFGDYFIFYKRWKLNDALALEECCLDGKDKGVDFSEHENPYVAKTTGQEQLYTGGEYATTKEFDDYYSIMNERKKIVCLIRINEGNFSGTGFLIAKNMIITNAHVVSQEKYDRDFYTEMSAVFFYETGKQENEKLIIPLLVKEKAGDKGVLDIVHTSRKRRIPSKDGLDFTIIRFDTTLQSFSAQKQILALAKIAKDFFQRPIEEQFWVSRDKDQKGRANIIQHPLKAVKHIAFRENKVRDLEQFLIHYKSRTNEGSSGAPVISDQGKFIAIHASGCDELENDLFAKIGELLKELGGGKKGIIKDGKYCGTVKTNQDGSMQVEVHLSGPFKGLCQETGKSGTFPLLFLLEKKGETAPRTYAYDFLKRCGVKITKVHTFCNTAINGIAIFDNLDRKGKLSEIKLAQQIKFVDYFIPYATLTFSRTLVKKWPKITVAALLGSSVITAAAAIALICDTAKFLSAVPNLTNNHQERIFKILF